MFILSLYSSDSLVCDNVPFHCYLQNTVFLHTRAVLAQENFTPPSKAELEIQKNMLTVSAVSQVSWLTVFL